MLNNKKIILYCLVIFSFFYSSFSIAQEISETSQKTIEAFHKEIKKVYVVFEAAKDGVFVNVFPLSLVIR